MKYLVRLRQQQYGEVVVEAENEDAARAAATSVRPLNAHRTYIVTEVCPHCENEIEMYWNTDDRGYQAVCPVCGGRLMLCDECMHSEAKAFCDYNSNTDSCHRQRKDEKA